MKFVISSNIVFLLFWASSTSAVQLIQGPISQRVNAGATVTLECIVSSIQAGESVVWKHVEHVGEKFVSVNHLLYLTDPDLRRRYEVIWTNKARDFHLRIKDVQAIDAGNYECGYTDSRQSFMKLAQATLSVEVPMEGAPTCNVFPKRPNVGDSVALSCSVAPGVVPAKTLIWEMNGREVLRKAGTSILTYDKFLQPSDEGATFRCKSISSAYPDEPFCTVTPLPRPPVATVQADAPFYEVGDNATFVCSEQSGENVQYTWTQVDVNILLNRRAEVRENNRVLTITNLEESDNNSVIECQVKTSDNRLSKGASITIKLRTSTTSGTVPPTVLSPLVEKNSLHPAVIVVFVLLVVAIVVILALVLIRCSRRKSPRKHSKM